MNILMAVTAAVLVLALVAWRSFYRTGGLERYFWSAALTFFLFEDVAAHHAALAAFKSIPFGFSRNNIVAALSSLADTTDAVILLFLWAGTTSPLSRVPLSQATDTIQRRALQLLLGMRMVSNDRRRLKSELASVAPEYADALAGVTRTWRHPNALFRVFSRLDPEAVKRIHTFFTP
jgi:hypothetical protein